MARRTKMHRIKVRGVGRLTVTGKLPKVQKTVLVAGKYYPITKQKFMEAWALSHHTDKSFKELLAERVSEPKSRVKLSPSEKFRQEVQFRLGYGASSGDISHFYERGFTVEQAASAIQREAREREDSQKKRSL